MDVLLKPADAEEICEELAKAAHCAKELGLLLGLSEDEIESSQQREDQLLSIIRAFLIKAGSTATWRTIIEALKSPPVNLKALAMKLEEDHSTKIQPSTPTVTRYFLHLIFLATYFA